MASENNLSSRGVIIHSDIINLKVKFPWVDTIIDTQRHLE